MKEKIIAILKSIPSHRTDFKTLAKVLQIRNNERKLLDGVLRDMEKEGSIFRPHPNEIIWAEETRLVEGVLQGNARGFAFLLREDGEKPDIYIPAEALQNAYDKDRVRVLIEDAQDERPQGKVVRVLERGHHVLVGLYKKTRPDGSGLVYPDESKFASPLSVDAKSTGGAKDGQKVMVEVRHQGKNRPPQGKVTAILGYPGVNETDMQSIILSFGLREGFPPEAKKEAREVSQTVCLDGRYDARSLETVTIDGEDAKDLDDAISIEKIEGNGTRLWVHIADVSHYVKPGMAMDEEAYLRGNSAYLIDRVLPMLPTELSNGICSLNPGEDRCALSLCLDFLANGQLESKALYETVIRSDARLTYEEVNRYFTGEELPREHQARQLLLDEGRQLMHQLKAQRVRRGSMMFDFPEMKITLDRDAKPVNVERLERGEAEMMIEEFMIIANEVIAQHWGKRADSFVYRVHGKPSEEKLVEFNRVLSRFGYELDLDAIEPKTLQQIVTEVKGKPEELLLTTLMLRSMQKAVYSPEDIGHFGLASEGYTHFTAPIRRYADLMVHRILKAMLHRQADRDYWQVLRRELKQQTTHISDRERVAGEAERQVEKFKMAQYMADHVGEIFEGRISTLTSFGFFVELPNTIEGLVKFSSMEDDHYNFLEDTYQVVGERTGKRWQLGDPVTVQVAYVDMGQYNIDFTLVEDEDSGKKGKSQSAGD